MEAYGGTDIGEGGTDEEGIVIGEGGTDMVKEALI